MPGLEGWLGSERRFGPKQLLNLLLKEILMLQDEFEHGRDSVCLAIVANISF